MNKVVLITGASRGIGKATAIKFAKNGYNVVINYNRSEEDARNVLKEVTNIYLKTNNSFGQALLFKADVSKMMEVQKMVETVLKVFGRIDCLVNNAGIAEIKPIIDVTEADYDRMMNTNLKGVFNTCKFVVPVMISNKNGKIINVSSVWGIKGSSCEVTYCASKAGILGLTKALAKELGPSGINVNSVLPGLIDTDMNNDLTSEDKLKIVNETPLSRIGQAEDVANLIYFLASDEASFITGEEIKVDGGWV